MNRGLRLADARASLCFELSVVSLALTRVITVSVPQIMHSVCLSMEIRSVSSASVGEAEAHFIGHPIEFNMQD